MFLSLLQFFATKFLFLALHLEAGSFPRPLSPQEEIRTFAALRTGDSSAREKLIRHNLRLVAHIAKKYYALPSEQDDLISIGTIGLMKAVDTFDSTRRARFSTYASRCIENELRMHFRRERKNAPTLSLQETLDAGKEDSALTLADVLQDGFSSAAFRPASCCVAGRLLHGGQLRKTGRCPAPAPPHRGVACPGAETHIIKVRSGGPAAADPAGNGKAAPNKPELRFPA